MICHVYVFTPPAPPSHSPIRPHASRVTPQVSPTPPLYSIPLANPCDNPKHFACFWRASDARARPSCVCVRLNAHLLCVGFRGRSRRGGQNSKPDRRITEASGARRCADLVCGERAASESVTSTQCASDPMRQ